MRGLKGPMGGRGRGALAAGTTAIAGFAAIGLFTAACSTGGDGVQDEGSAHAEAKGSLPAAPAAPSMGGDAGQDAAQRTEDIDPVKLIKTDPKVSARVKADLRPCGESADYPVDSSYGNITGSGSPDVVVNVVACGDGVGLGTFVYRVNGTAYENVFALEEAAVYSAIDRGDLVVTKQLYAKDDPVATPSAEEVTTYHWASGKFSRLHWVRTEFSGAVGVGGLENPEPTARPEEN
ncbi:hypothetical protein ACWF94_05160 [Streptomyces sp. NPDC055078]